MVATPSILWIFGYRRERSKEKKLGGTPKCCGVRKSETVLVYHTLSHTKSEEIFTAHMHIICFFRLITCAIFKRPLFHSISLYRVVVFPSNMRGTLSLRLVCTFVVKAAKDSTWKLFISPGYYYSSTLCGVLQNELFLSVECFALFSLKTAN